MPDPKTQSAIDQLAEMIKLMNDQMSSARPAKKGGPVITVYSDAQVATLAAGWMTVSIATRGGEVFGPLKHALINGRNPDAPPDSYTWDQKLMADLKSYKNNLSDPSSDSGHSWVVAGGSMVSFIQLNRQKYKSGSNQEKAFNIIVEAKINDVGMSNGLMKTP